jgi:NAD(P)-dependent dehydrogenase (short-subunit alcohol dehydrogenase family)
VISLADEVAASGPLDVLINNAAQTVRRSPGAYAALAAAESQPLPSGPLPELLTFGRTSDAHPHALAGALGAGTLAVPDALDVGASHHSAVTELALTARSAPVPGWGDLVASGGAVTTMERGIDAGGLVPDVDHVNSWTQVVDQVDPVELLEVQLCNQTAPFILISRLRASMAASSARRTYVVNVSAMEGQFSRKYKGPGHPHTNMAKAALNMLTLTSAGEMLADGILMTAVDTGWITDERPHHTKVRLAAEGFHAPLDLVDGAARVYDPIVRGEGGEDVYGCFLKDFQPSPW